MIETVEFRIPEREAREHLPAGAGTVLGTTVRRLTVRREDALFALIGQIDHAYRSKGRAFFTSWIAHREYTAEELNGAEVLHLIPKSVFEPAGEQCGTVYDDTTACSSCGAGGVQATPLFLKKQRIPRGVDCARTIAGEFVVSSGFVEIFRARALSGAVFEPVRSDTADRDAAAGHYQLIASGPGVQLDRATRAGNDPYDEDCGGACPRGDTFGLNLLSEVWIAATSYIGQDVVATSQFVGVRRGLLRPRPVVLISQRGWRAMQAAGLKGFTVEVAHLA